MRYSHPKSIVAPTSYKRQIFSDTAAYILESKK